ncbi:hypothetical protein P691DRAFT_778485 [Macrolepiota fuliginosa MF-IS2]|uniref:Fe2OG dioxygenase domain-containing protein n=1 Tax=Macrolepiota fuliginosa MF-IS2 TaxID=1400762 RepID=A0A9P5X3F7_9AGAR|nr:hypothetical protein P691DRAFT_778485 [Macrolepiota fuliginosa MF-IS2]
MESDILAQFATGAEQFRNVRFTTLSAVTVLVLDLFLTFSMEVVCVWKAPWNAIKLLYLVIRYMPFIDVTTAVIFLFSYALPIHTCKSLYQFTSWMFCFGKILTDVIFTLRTWAVWGRNKYVGLLLVICCITSWLVILIFNGLYLKSVVYGISPVPRLMGCIATSSTTLLSVPFVAKMALSTTMLLLMIIAIISTRTYSGLLKVIFRDGIIYYIYTFISAFINFYVNLKLPKPYSSLFLTFLQLGSTTVAQAEDLSNACELATFGLNHKDVLDETYRKAGKIDAGNFAWLFGPSDRSDFANKLVSGLFPWEAPDRGIRFELYKLNVYGEGSFFKAHQDTPRSEDMFGSLVVLLPFTHEGGSLLLRHRGREFEFDGQALLQDAPSTASAAYVAFFSDVEHEVARVASGHRVTVTFNLYFDANKSAPVIQAPVDPQLEHPFKTALNTIIDNPALRLVHPFIGFGLEHAYPFKSAILGAVDLKGSDANLVKTLYELGIRHRFFLLYREDRENRYCPFRVLTRYIVDGDQGDDMTNELEMVAGAGSFLVWDKDPKEVAKDPPRCSDWYDCYEEDKRQYKRMKVEWVTEPSEEFVDRSTTIAYGNEASLAYHYHQLCVVATLFPRELPEKVEKDMPIDSKDGATDEDGADEEIHEGETDEEADGDWTDEEIDGSKDD